MTRQHESPTSASPTTGRNAPCPCGSGKKFKRCCEGKTWTHDESGHRKSLINPFSVMIVFIMIGALGVWGVAELASTSTSSGHEVAPLQSSDDGDTPEPWYYDEENNRHWNPQSGHAHWHSGPPPPESLR